jgi:Zn-dependent peptidase ImmA (M78 family)
MPRAEASPNPAVLVWARESAGFTLEAAARKLKVEAERLAAWESGGQRPSFAQLRRTAAAYKRALAIFYLAEPPKKFEPIRDYRRVAEATGGQLSPALTQEIRKAQDRREWALDFFKELTIPVPTTKASISLNENFDVAATRIREVLGVTVEIQARWRDQYQAFREWRERLETVGVLTFQASAVAVAEVRGFSISKRPLPVAVANIKDAPRGRIFTLLHELAHILLNDGGICDLHESENEDVSRVETYCNRVAGAILFSREQFLASGTVRNHRRGDPKWTDEELSTLSSQFGGSREAALVRLLTLDLTTRTFYAERKDEFLKIYAEQRKREKGFVPPHEIALTSAGPTFASLVVESFNRENITASDVSDFLQIRLKHLSDVQREFVRFS